MLTLVSDHEHEFKRYILRDTQDAVVEKEYTELDFDLVPKAYFIGFDCECGVEGYQS